MKGMGKGNRYGTLRTLVITGCLVIVGGLAIGVATVRAADEVTVAGQPKPRTGEITSATAQQVVLKDRNATEPVIVKTGDVVEIRWDKEPSQLSSVRSAIKRGDWESAHTTIHRMTIPDSARKELRAEMEFLRAYTAGRVALTTGQLTAIPRGGTEPVTLGGTAAFSEAGNRMNRFLRQYPDTWRTFQATMTLAELLAAAGRYQNAQNFYQKAADQATNSEGKIRSTFQLARLQAISGKDAEAMKRFDAILALKDTKSVEIRSMKLQSQLGRARLLVSTNPDESLAVAARLLDEATKEDSEIPEAERASVLAQSWLIRGLVLESRGNSQDATFAFLRVDVMYPEDRFAHAEALSHLVILLEKSKRLERAAEMRRTLLARYPDTPWAPRP
ncbi:MAG: hypothetical protein Q4C47_09430 [Planctomycetia bacterium]|nr:hypothetical protein [Planctomycetia bacterium]